MTGWTSLAELERMCPGRVFRFVLINIPHSEVQAHRDEIVSLMHPHNTEMDLSIALALYFAARGSGFVSRAGGGGLDAYRTPAKVLLSGLGADELFGGYMRHARAFERNGLTGLLDELELDIGRLAKRNLGRDDRVTSNWGREVRYPYLDEKLLDWALKASVPEKCGFGEQQGRIRPEQANDAGITLEPGKKVLRCLALKLGMEVVAKEKKRAVWKLLMSLSSTHQASG